MFNQKTSFYVLLVFLLGAITLSFFVLQPFLYPLILAMIAALLCRPLHKYVLGVVGKQRKSIASLLTAIIVVVGTVVPLSFVGFQVFKEAQMINEAVTAGDARAGILFTLEHKFEELAVRYPVLNALPFDLSIDAEEITQSVANFLAANAQAILANVASITLSFFVFLIALYYLLRDGATLAAKVRDLSPLSDDASDLIISRVERAVSSVVKGSLIVAMVQGVLTSVGFLLFGVPDPLLWGAITAVAALIPGIGTSLVIIPAVLYLFIAVSPLAAFGLAIWGAGAVGLIDNMLGPTLVGKGAELHPLLVLLSVLGGLAFFGPIGFLLGPLVLSLVIALLDAFVHARTA